MRTSRHSALLLVLLAACWWWCGTALDKSGLDEAESEVERLASEIAAKYRNKCELAANCQKSISAVGRDLEDILDSTNTRVRDVCDLTLQPHTAKNNIDNNNNNNRWNAATARQACVCARHRRQ